jgi:hypothetical protein
MEKANSGNEIGYTACKSLDENKLDGLFSKLHYQRKSKAIGSALSPLD